MNRRDFLLLRQSPGEIVAELDTHALYMRVIDATLTYRVDDDGVTHEIESRSDWVQQLRERLNGVSAVLVVDSEFLADDGFRRGVNQILEEVSARGGRVERRQRE